MHTVVCIHKFDFSWIFTKKINNLTLFTGLTRVGFAARGQWLAIQNGHLEFGDFGDFFLHTLLTLCFQVTDALPGNRGTLDVPPRPPWSPWRLPEGLLRLGCLPQGKVPHVPLLCVLCQFTWRWSEKEFTCRQWGVFWTCTLEMTHF